MSTLPGEKGRQRSRSRIVVSVEDGPQPGGGGGREPQSRVWHGERLRARRRRRLLSLSGLVLLVVVLALLAGAYLWYQGLKSKPAYSLALAADAAARGDAQTFERYVDVEQVSRGLVPQVIEQLSGGRGGVQVPPQVRRNLVANAGIFLPGVRDGVREEAMRQIKDAYERGGAGSYPFFVRAIALSRAVESEAPGINGEERDVTRTITYRLDERPVELGVRCLDERCAGWRVVSIRSDDLAGRVAERLARTFPIR